MHRLWRPETEHRMEPGLALQMLSFAKRWAPFCADQSLVLCTFGASEMVVNGQKHQSCPFLGNSICPGAWTTACTSHFAGVIAVFSARLAAETTPMEDRCSCGQPDFSLQRKQLAILQMRCVPRQCKKPQRQKRCGWQWGRPPGYSAVSKRLPRHAGRTWKSTKASLRRKVR